MILDKEELESDIEVEEGNEDVIIEIPFDPNKIKVVTKSYSVGQIVQDLEDKTIDLDTEFQRLPGLWNNEKKSQFIESLLLNLPIPTFYFNEKEENNWEVIDGLQRISTIYAFLVEKNLVLTGLEFLTEYNGFKFDDLPNPLQKRITRFGITIYIIEKTTPVEVKFHIFKRVNTGGLMLTPQEIRHAINQGIPAELIADLARGVNNNTSDGAIRIRKNSDGTVVDLKATDEGKAFVKVTENRINSTRMEDRDFVTRFVAFYLIPYQEYKPDLDSFLNKGMERIKELNKAEIENLKFDFKSAMNLAYHIFGNDAFRKRFSKTDKRKPINKALFEVLSVNLAKLSLGNREIIKAKKNIFKQKLIELHNAKDGKFVRSISQGTAQKDLVTQRFSDIERIIKETVEND
ncbi:DUF262 domain-containing protein [Flavobacterium sp. K77]|uniref:DUF262 domain-containing protein n=1 Tax=Flavobacterium sp. K77 TaxID=2910676 RepID=UPI001F224BEE|nr:DUF262 domain-containing protein [Flavobacterium sp. K77]MCF6140697.1 DUF262 domain-containing protein [Flavobacterium sp. K77]